MFEFFRGLVPFVVPILDLYHAECRLNGENSSHSRALEEHTFHPEMLLANFVLVPLFTIVILNIVSFDPALKAGLLLFGLCAGAPFLIKLTQVSEKQAGARRGRYDAAHDGHDNLRAYRAPLDPDRHKS